MPVSNRYARRHTQRRTRRRKDARSDVSTPMRRHSLMTLRRAMQLSFIFANQRITHPTRPLPCAHPASADPRASPPHPPLQEKCSRGGGDRQTFRYNMVASLVSLVLLVALACLRLQHTPEIPNLLEMSQIPKFQGYQRSRDAGLWYLSYL